MNYFLLFLAGAAAGFAVLGLAAGLLVFDLLVFDFSATLGFSVALPVGLAAGLLAGLPSFAFSAFALLSLAPGLTLDFAAGAGSIKRG